MTNKKSNSNEKPSLKTKSESVSSELENLIAPLSSMLENKEIHIDNLINQKWVLEDSIVEGEHIRKNLDYRLSVSESAVKELQDQLEKQNLALQTMSTEYKKTIGKLRATIEDIHQAHEVACSDLKNLVGVIDVLDRRHEDLFNSKTWRFGNLLAETSRFLRLHWIFKAKITKIDREHLHTIIHTDNSYKKYHENK